MDVLRQPRRDAESLLGAVDGLVEQLVPAQHAVVALRGREHRDRTRYAGGAPGQHRLRTRQRMPVRVVKQRRRGQRGRRLAPDVAGHLATRSEEHTSELQSLMRISYAVFCLKKKKNVEHSTTATN